MSKDIEDQGDNASKRGVPPDGQSSTDADGSTPDVAWSVMSSNDDSPNDHGKPEADEAPETTQELKPDIFDQSGQQSDGNDSMDSGNIETEKTVKGGDKLPGLMPDLSSDEIDTVLSRLDELSQQTPPSTPIVAQEEKDLTATETSHDPSGPQKDESSEQIEDAEDDAAATVMLDSSVIEKKFSAEDVADPVTLDSPTPVKRFAADDQGVATVMLDTSAPQDEVGVEDDEKAEVEEAATVMLDSSTLLEEGAEEAEVPDVATAQLDSAVLQQLVSGEAEVQDAATVMLDSAAQQMVSGEEAEVGDVATALLDSAALQQLVSAEAEAQDAATVMLDSAAQQEMVSVEEEYEGATQMLDASVPDVKEQIPSEVATTMLESPLDGEPETAQEEKKPSDVGTVLVDTSVLKESSGKITLPDFSAPTPSGQVGMFEDHAEKLEEIADKRVDIVADPRMPSIGDVVADRYEITEVIGQGGFAAVYLAEDTAISGKVAIKVLQPEKSHDTGFAERFRQEVRLARHLQHPNTIKVSDTGTTENDCLYMVMEHITGIGLDEYLTKKGALAPAQAARIGEQILRSLAEAHSAGIIHRDLKPTNVMISKVGAEDDYVKVLDFGIAKALVADLSTAKTETGIVFCTPKYAAPEVLLSKDLGPTVDVYSLGLILLETLTGYPVYVVESDAEAIAHQLSDEPVPIPEEVAGTALGPVLERALKKNPADRYKNATAMLSDMKGIGLAALTTEPIPLSDATTQRLAASSFIDTHIFDKLEIRPAADPQKAAVLTQLMPSQRRSMLLPMLVVFAFILAAAATTVWLINNRRDDRQGDPTDDTTVVATNLPDELGGETPTDDERGPHLPNSRDILGARLAASDWQAGSWLEAEVEQTAVGEPTDTLALVTEVPGTEVTPIIVDFDLTSVDFTIPVTPTEPIIVASVDAEAAQAAEAEAAVARAIAAKAEAHRMALLYESAEANNAAFDLLHSALTADLIRETDETAAYDQLLSLTENLVAVLVRLDRCDAAERRLDRSLAVEELDQVAAQPTVTLIRSDIEACRVRVAAQQQEWDPSAYVAQIAEGDRLYETAMATEDPEAHRTIMFEAVHARQQAIDMIETALNEGRIPEASREFAGRDLAQLNDEVTATLMDLNLSVAVEVQIEDTLENAELLPEDAAEDLQVVLTAIEAEEEAEAEVEMAALDESAEGEPGAEGELGPTDEASLDGTGTGALALLEGTGATVEPSVDVGWDLERFGELTQAGSQLLEQAEDVAIEIRLAAAAMEDSTTESGMNGDLLSTDWTLPLGLGEGTGTVAARRVYSIQVSIDSTPSRCRVVLDGETIGRTPFSEIIESEEEEITLSVSKSEYVSERVTISMIEGDVETSVELEARNPFGQTQTLGDTDRRRR